MSIQQSGYIWEKGRTQGNLFYESEVSLLLCYATYVSSSAGFSCVNQLTFTTFSYSSGELIAIGI